MAGSSRAHRCIHKDKPASVNLYAGDFCAVTALDTCNTGIQEAQRMNSLKIGSMVSTMAAGDREIAPRSSGNKATREKCRDEGLCTEICCQ